MADRRRSKRRRIELEDTRIKEEDIRVEEEDIRVEEEEEEEEVVVVLCDANSEHNGKEITIKYSRKAAEIIDGTQDKIPLEVPLLHEPLPDELNKTSEEENDKSFTSCESELVDDGNESVEDEESKNIVCKVVGKGDDILPNYSHPYLCDRCGVSFTRETQYKRHQQTHDDDEDDDNDEDYIKEEKEKQEEGEKSEEEGRFLCMYCNERFAKRKEFRKHIATHEMVNNETNPKSSKKRKKNADPEFKCGVCSETHTAANYATFLVDHVKEHFKNSCCKSCEAPFTKDDLFKLLRKTELDAFDDLVCIACTAKERSVIECDLCGRTFLCSGNFVRHAKELHSEKIAKSIMKYPCTTCGKKFDDSSSFKEHLPLHKDDESLSFLCEKCGKKFAIQKYLADHIRRVHGINKHSSAEKTRKLNPRFACSVCDKSFQTKYVFNEHMETHKAYETRQHVCSLCDKRFSLRRYLTDHLRRTHGLVLQNASTIQSIPEHAYSCEVCEKTFSTFAHLKDHVKIHLDYEFREYSCSVCQKKFTLRRYLTDHYKRVHGCSYTQDDDGNEVMTPLEDGIETNIPCDVCGKTFSQRFHLKEHMTLHTSNLSEHECEICSKKFLIERYLKQHYRRVHGLTAAALRVTPADELKDKSGMSLNDLQSVDKKYQCEVCQKRFFQKVQLDRHMFSHSNVKNHVCIICSNSFVLKRYLSDHYRRVHGMKAKDLSDDELVTMAGDPYEHSLAQENNEDNLGSTVDIDYPTTSSGSVDENQIASSSIDITTSSSIDDLTNSSIDATATSSIDAGLVVELINNALVSTLEIQPDDVGVVTEVISSSSVNAGEVQASSNLPNDSLSSEQQLEMENCVQALFAASDSGDVESSEQSNDTTDRTL